MTCGCALFVAYLLDSFFDTSTSPSGGNSPLDVDSEIQDVDEVEDAGDIEPFYKNDGCMVVSHLNIRSVFSMFDNLRVFLESRNRTMIFGVKRGWMILYI